MVLGAEQIRGTYEVRCLNKVVNLRGTGSQFSRPTLLPAATLTLAENRPDLAGRAREPGNDYAVHPLERIRLGAQASVLNEKYV